jgi:hypothetical protein
MVLLLLPFGWIYGIPLLIAVPLVALIPVIGPPLAAISIAIGF